MKTLLFTIILLLNALYAKQQDNKIVLQLSWLNQFQFAGYYTALEKGYYRDAGLDVRIKEFDKNVNLIDDVLTRKADFAVGRSSLLIDKAEGKDITAIAAMYQSSPLMLLSLKNRGIEKIEDLKNKRIMITPDAKDTAAIMAMLISNGMGEDDIVTQKHSFDLNDLINGNTDAMASYISNEPVRLKDMGIEYNIFHPKDYGFDFYSDILFTSSKFLEKNPALTKKFYKATVKGWKYAFKNIAETAELIHRKYNTQNKSLISLVKEAEVLRGLIHHEGTDEIGCLDADKLKNILNTYKVVGLVQKDFDMDDFIYTENDHTALSIKLKHDDFLLLVVISILFLIVLIFSMFYVSIKRKWLHTHNELMQTIEDQKVAIEKQNQFILSQSKITAVSDLLKNIAHQWRQPLTIITTAASSLKLSREIKKELPEKILDKTLEAILKEANYLSKVIDDFHAHFNTQSSTIADYNLKKLFEKIMDIYRFEFENAYVKYIESIDDNVNLKLNEGLFIQAVMVIFKNSVDAFEINKIPNSARYLFVDIKEKDNSVEVIIKDSAGGIKEDVIPHIFEPYFTTKHQYIGTGIGLYMANQIITHHLNGRIEVCNEEYKYDNKILKGACFKITFGNS